MEDVPIDPPALPRDVGPVLLRHGQTVAGCRQERPERPLAGLGPEVAVDQLGVGLEAAIGDHDRLRLELEVAVRRSRGDDRPPLARPGQRLSPGPVVDDASPLNEPEMQVPHGDVRRRRPVERPARLRRPARIDGELPVLATLRLEGDALARQPFDAGLRLVGDHPREVRCDLAAGHVVDVGEHGLRLQVHRAHGEVEGAPGQSNPRRAAKLLASFEGDDVRSELLGPQRGRDARRPSADDDDVTHVHVLPPETFTQPRRWLENGAERGGLPFPPLGETERGYAPKGRAGGAE